MLLKEIHHRVKNNLQVVSSLLNLQARFIKDDSAKDALDTGIARVQAMTLLHQKLYKHDNIQKVNIKEYFEELGKNLFHTYKFRDKHISFNTHIEDIALDIDLAVPMGLIANELISNALKHAFYEKSMGVIDLKISKQANTVYMSVADNGKGLPFETIPQTTDSLGMELIKSFAEKLDAEIIIDNQSGCCIQFIFEVQNEDPDEIFLYSGAAS